MSTLGFLTIASAAMSLLSPDRIALCQSGVQTQLANDQRICYGQTQGSADDVFLLLGTQFRCFSRCYYGTK